VRHSRFMNWFWPSQPFSETAVPEWQVSVCKKRLKRRKKKGQSSEVAEPKVASATGGETVVEEMLLGSPSMVERTMLAVALRALMVMLLM